MNRLTLLLAGLAFTGIGYTHSAKSNPQPSALPALSEGLRNNPFLKDWGEVGALPFNDIKPEHYAPAYDHGLAEQQRVINAIKAQKHPTFENTIEALCNSAIASDKVETACSSLHSSIRNPALTKAMNYIDERSTQFETAYYLDEGLFRKIDQVFQDHKRDNFKRLSLEQQRLMEKYRKNFLKRGTNLDANGKKRLEKINNALSELTTQFRSALMEATASNPILVSLPEAQQCGLKSMITDARTKAAEKLGKKGHCAFGLDMGTARGFLTLCTKRDLRKQMFLAYNGRGMTPVKIKDKTGKDTEVQSAELIKQIVTLRTEKAVLLSGKADCTHLGYTIQDRMGYKNPKELEAFLADFMGQAVTEGKKDQQALEKLLVADFPGAKLEPWDWYYYENHFIQKNAFDPELLKEYFELGSVRDGAFTVAQRLYGLEFKPNKSTPVYHEDVQAYDVYDRNGSRLGLIYMDFYTRLGQKNGGAWCGTFRNQWQQDNRRITPVVYLVCNFPKPNAGQPCLLSQDDVTTLFHEFGHALHNLLSNVKYRDLSCTAVPKDFVEMPSQVMEYWAKHEQFVLDESVNYARHYKTGEKISEAFFKKVSQSNFGQHFKTIEFIGAAMLDVQWHNMTLQEIQALQNKTGVEVVQTIEAKAAKLTKLNEIPITFRYLSTNFSHIFASSYDASYYVYQAAELYNADAFAAFEEEEDIFDEDLAEALRENVLSVGGSRDLAESYREFRGDNPDPRHMYEKRGLQYPEKDEDR